MADGPNIHSLYEWVRRITDQIVTHCMQGYVADEPNIHCVYERVRRMTDQLVIHSMQVRWLTN